MHHDEFSLARPSTNHENTQPFIMGSESSEPGLSDPSNGTSTDPPIQEVPQVRISGEVQPATRNGHRHARSLSVSTINSSKLGNATLSFIKRALESISSIKEVTKKHEHLVTLCKAALERVQSGDVPENTVIFEPLREACQTDIVEAKIIALDCLGKLFSFNVFDTPTEVKAVYATHHMPSELEVDNAGLAPPGRQTMPLIDAAIETIAGCFEGEGTNEKVELQVIRVLMAGILNESMPAHGATLLRAVRQIYNVFLLSLSPINQGIAQATLTQVVNVVFERVRDAKLPNEFVVEKKTFQQELTLENLENPQENEQAVKEATQAVGEERELVVKDVFLLFRAMCKLSVKPLGESLDMRSHAVRSKLLSLHIIYSALSDHLETLQNAVIVSASGEKTGFMDSIKQYLCLTLSRNAASLLVPVFEICLEMFWLIQHKLRFLFKREISVFWTEIYFPLAEMKTSTPHQKRYLLSVISRLCSDPTILVEFYLNYDCDPTMPNILETVVDHLAKLALTHVEVNLNQKLAFKERQTRPLATYQLSNPPLLSISKLGSHAPDPDANANFPLDYGLKMTSIECIVSFLRSLSWWKNQETTVPMTKTPSSRQSSLTELDTFETSKLRKTALLEGIRRFNVKPKKGIESLEENGFIPSHTPQNVALFLLNTEGLDKAQIGEYLGEGDDFNVSTMHAFVESMEFRETPFVSAMRNFLQKFRLPGESQKIDRYMLKFAERYVDGNPGVFANADTAYILAYSVIMLNTDQHSSQVKQRMSLEEFIRNNSGIDDGRDLSKEFLQSVFDEIRNDEIKLQSEQHEALLQSTLLGKDSRVLYMEASRQISSKAEDSFRALKKNSSKEEFFSATPHTELARSVFDTLWMSLLAGLTPPFKEYDDEDTARVCLDGIKLSVHIAGTFSLEYARTSFIGALVQFANLHNFQELKLKNVMAVYALLELAIEEGSFLRDSWKEVLLMISQIERLQLLAQGIDSEQVPDVAGARIHRSSMESSASNGFFSQFNKKYTPSEIAYQQHQNQQLSEEVIPLVSSTDLVVAMDKVFSHSSQLSGDGIVDFVKALTSVSFEEIESSGTSPHPRMFSLQKMVDVCYYNMGRIRVEWSALWQIMGETFNMAGCNGNTTIVFFALDSLRQLSMRFFEIDELPHFQFQKEFLKPFQYIFENNTNLPVRTMVIECTAIMVQTKSSHMRSGWSSIFGILTAAALESSEKIVFQAYQLVSQILRERYTDVCNQNAYDKLTECVTCFARSEKFQKISLHALQDLKNLMKSVSTMEGDTFEHRWFPTLFGFHEVIMRGEDLEVRSRALNYMFDSLVLNGGKFSSSQWDQICQKLLFPIFHVLSTHWQVNQFNSQDDMSVWLSTTLIQALRNMIALFTHYFETLNRMLDGYLSLLVSCICQENDTIARIGRSCLQQLIIQNMEKFDLSQWKKVNEAFAQLFELTTAKELLQAPKQDLADSLSRNGSVDVGKPAARSDKSSIVVKCVLQLLMIETLSELFENEEFYRLVPYESLTNFAGLLNKSYQFSRAFNDNYELRMQLWNAGVIERLPNLLKQETSASAVYINVMLRIYCDGEKASGEQRDEIAASLVPLCVTIVERYVTLDDVSQPKNITSWRPVIVEILHGYVELDEGDFTKNAKMMYDLVLRILDKGMPTELRSAVKLFLSRVGSVYL